MISGPTEAVEFIGIGKSFGSCRAVDHVTGNFSAGRIHAILGENGAGKSTLMKLLFGLYGPTEGKIRVKGTERHWRSPADSMDAGLGMVQQHFTLVESLSVIDNIMLGAEACSAFGVLDRERAIQLLEAELPSADLSLDWNRQVSDLSVGEKQKVEILKLIARKADILVLDEPTAVLAPQEISGLFSILKELKKQGRTVFVITHKLGEVFEHCDTWFVLRAGRSIASGEVHQTKVEDVVRAMVGTNLPPLSDLSKRNPGEARLKFENVSVKKTSHVLNNLSFEVRSGEIVGIAGIDGSGQAEVVAASLGLVSFSGEITVLGDVIPGSQSSDAAAKRIERLRNAGLALVSEDRHTQSLWMNESVQLNTGLGVDSTKSFFKNGLLQSKVWTTAVSNWLKSFDVRFPSLEISVDRLSGGNQQKLIFARELLGRTPRLIVVHQPTRGVDFLSIRLIYERLLEAREGGAAILVISSELDELMTLSDRIFVLCAGRKTGEFIRATDTARGAFDRTAIGAAMTSASPMTASEQSSRKQTEVSL